MPFFRFHFTDPMKLMIVSREMTDRLQEVIGCPREHIVLEVIHSDLVGDGEILEGSWPLVEVDYFERPIEIQDQVARIVATALQEAGYMESDMHFRYLREENYYENGISYKTNT